MKSDKLTKYLILIIECSIGVLDTILNYLNDMEGYFDVDEDGNNE